LVWDDRFVTRFKSDLEESATMGLLHNPNLRTRFTNFLAPLSPIQHVAVASATYFLLFTIGSDAVCWVTAPLCSTSFKLAMPFAAIPTFIGVVLPGSVILWIYSEIHQLMNGSKGRRPPVAVIVRRMLLYSSVLILSVFPVGVFIFVELWFPVSAVPFVTTLTALTLIQTTKGIMPSVPAGRRRALTALLVIMVLFVKYVDFNTRKPFTRHLFLVHRGMTGAEVEKIMGRHLKNYVEPESDHYLHLEPHFTGTAMYRHTTEWWGNVDWGAVSFEDGRAVGAEVCLCD
jgi:hypothetical protein